MIAMASAKVMFGVSESDVLELADRHEGGARAFILDMTRELELGLNNLRATPSREANREMIQLCNRMKCVIASRLMEVRPTLDRMEGQMEFGMNFGADWQPWLYACSMLSDLQEVLHIQFGIDTGWVRLQSMTATIARYIEIWLGVGDNVESIALRQ